MTIEEVCVNLLICPFKDLAFAFHEAVRQSVIHL